MIRAPTYAITTMRMYGNTNPKKIINGAGGTGGGNADIAATTMTGTDVTAASAAITAYRGRVGTTTLKMRTQAATHDRPTQGVWGLTDAGRQNSAVAMP